MRFLSLGASISDFRLKCISFNPSLCDVDIIELSCFVHGILFLQRAVFTQTMLLVRAGWSWKQNFLLQLMLPLVITLLCTFKFLGSKLAWKLCQSGQRPVRYKLLTMLFTVPESEQSLKVSACGPWLRLNGQMFLLEMLQQKSIHSFAAGAGP